MKKVLLLLDRDGVINRLVIDAEQGTIDSPLHPSQVRLIDGVAEALAKLTEAGFGLAVVTNQPAWAKGKTTRINLEEAHAKALSDATHLGGVIRSSHVCLHRAEDGCDCRKPKTGLLRQALKANAAYDPRQAWMIGDGVTDVQAGQALGLRTAFLGPRKCDACKILGERVLTPTWWGNDLVGFANYLLTANGDETHGGHQPACVACENLR